MPPTRLTVVFDGSLAGAIRRAARSEGISAWLADAARRKLRSEGLLRAVKAWEAEHGASKDGELRIARRSPRSH